MDELIKIFEKTFDDKNFSRSEKKAITQLLEQDYKLDKHKRDLLRGKLFSIARERLKGQSNQEVIDWLESAQKLLINRQDSAAFFSPGNQCLDEILRLLSQARVSVDICVFTISDNRIAKEILNCLDRGVNVRIVTDNEKVSDRGSDISHLEKDGIEVRVDRTHHHMHHKFAIFDRSQVLTGSYNWTRSAAEHNHENILTTDEKNVVAVYKEEFEKLWNAF